MDKAIKSSIAANKCNRSVFLDGFLIVVGSPGGPSMVGVVVFKKGGRIGVVLPPGDCDDVIGGEGGSFLTGCCGAIFCALFHFA